MAIMTTEFSRAGDVGFCRITARRSALISRTCLSESASSLRRSMRDNPRIAVDASPQIRAAPASRATKKIPSWRDMRSTREVAITGGNDLYATQIPFRV